MKRKIIILFFFLLLIEQVMPSSMYAKEQKQQEFQELMQEINQKNEQLNAPKNSIDHFRYNFKNNKPKLTKEDNAIMWKNYNKKKVKENISITLAKKEVQWLFRLLRSEYGLYKYYGGDIKFEKAKKKILKEISTGNIITTKKYQKILHENLNFINDSHLAIGEELFFKNVRLFSDESTHYIKKEEHFYEEENPKDKIITINGKNPNKYLKHAIDENGNLTYYPYAMLKQKKNSCKYIIKYQSGKTKKIILKPAKYSYKEKLDRIYGYDQYDNLAYVEMNQAYMDWDFPKERKRFLKDTKKMKNQKCLIFDLRNNTGGDGSLIEEWFLSYMGQELLPNYSTLRIRPIWISNKKELKEMDQFAKETHLKKSGKYYYIQYPKQQYLKNNGKKIFVLTSKRTCSAAEAMTDALKNIENVVTIGVNTGGVLINMANYSMAMPYSRLFLQFGTCLQYFDTSYFRESYGIEPDIYLTGKHLNKRLKKFFKSYADLS